MHSTIWTNHKDVMLRKEARPKKKKKHGLFDPFGGNKHSRQKHMHRK